MSIKDTVSSNLLITVNELINAAMSIPREFKNSGISTPSVNMSRVEIHIAPSILADNDVGFLAQGYCVAIVSVS